MVIRLNKGVHMQLTSFLQPAFRRAATYGSLVGGLLLSGCATVVPPKPDSCMGGGGVRLMGIGFTKTGFDEDCAKYQQEKLQAEADIARAETLMKRPNDPVGNALGMLLSLDLNPEAREKLQTRMSGADKIRVAPETLAGLLTADNVTSRYIGFQLYAASPEDVHEKVHALLAERNITLAMLMPVNLNDGAAPARQWARTHGQDGQTLPPLPARTITTCIRTRVGNQVILDCPKAITP